jgi:hypothetical protein
MQHLLKPVRVPVEAKALHYHADGTGRDSYIANHNGGLYTLDLIKKLNPKVKNSY